MLDFRYHALSLAAVLLALAVGVLIGVAIGDSNLVSSAKNGIVRNLRSEVSGAERHASQLQSRLGRSEAVGEDLYSIAVHELLSGRKVGLVFLGESSEQVNELVREAVAQAGGNLSTAVAVREPLELQRLAARAAGTQYAALGAQQGLIRAFGLQMASEIVQGGTLIDRERTSLLSAFDGSFGELGGIVLQRADPAAMSESDRAAASELEEGLIEGFGELGVPTVGVELTGTTPSQVPWYSAHDLASVDDLNTLDGRAALAFALAGAHGAFGVKPTAGALLPRVGGRASPPVVTGSRPQHGTGKGASRRRARRSSGGAARGSSGGAQAGSAAGAGEGAGGRSAAGEGARSGARGAGAARG